MRKQMEGDPERRRAKAKAARESGKSASEEGATTGASKQRDHAQGRERGHDQRGKHS